MSKKKKGNEKIVIDHSSSGDSIYMSREEMTELRSKYQEGMKIELVHMYEDDGFDPLPTGLLGVINYVDDIGTIHMTWCNGSSLGLIPQVDEFIFISDEEYEGKLKEWKKAESKRKRKEKKEKGGA